MNYYPILKAGNTGRKGAQYGNKNAAKDYRDFAEDIDNRDKMYALWPGEYHKNLTPEQAQAVQTYTGKNPIFNYSLINATLRKRTDMQTDNDVSRTVHHIVSSAKPLPTDLVLYRGVNKESPKGVFSHRGFTSGSLDPDQALRFGNTLMRIRVPAGTPVAYGDYEQEQEIILMPNSRFKRTPDENSEWGGTPVSEVEYVPSANRKKTRNG